MMFKRFYIRLAVLTTVLIQAKAFAYSPGQQLTVNTGVTSSVEQVISGITDVLLSWSVVVATAIFLIGALIMTASGGQETAISNGRKYMRDALIGFAIILAAWIIISTVVTFICDNSC